MIGGYYVFVIDPSPNFPGREYTGLIAGPFATWAEADAIGPRAVKHVNDNPGNVTNPEFGICEFWYSRLVLGIRNGPLWAKVTPVER